MEDHGFPNSDEAPPCRSHWGGLSHPLQLVQITNRAQLRREKGRHVTERHMTISIGFICWRFFHLDWEELRGYCLGMVSSSSSGPLPTNGPPGDLARPPSNPPTWSTQCWLVGHHVAWASGKQTPAATSWPPGPCMQQRALQVAAEASVQLVENLLSHAQPVRHHRWCLVEGLNEGWWCFLVWRVHGFAICQLSAGCEGEKSKLELDLNKERNVWF